MESKSSRKENQAKKITKQKKKSAEKHTRTVWCKIRETCR